MATIMVRPQIEHLALGTVIALAVASCCGRDRPSGPSPYATLSVAAPTELSPPRDRAGAVAAIKASPFASHQAALEKAMLPVIRMDAVARDAASIAMGASHLGGQPDVPSGFGWPEFKTRSLGFLAQLRLQDLPPEAKTGGLPETGWLLFFYELETGTWGFDPKDREAFRVMHLEASPESLVRTPAPATLPEASRDMRWSALQFVSGVSLPDPSDDAFPSLGIDLEVTGAREQYMALLARIEGVGPDNAYHHLLGYPQIIQNDMREEVQMASHGVYMGGPEGHDNERARALAAGAADWTLLLQLDSDDVGPGWSWGDSGTLYFWIRKQDLAARKFDAAWMVLQCY